MAELTTQFAPASRANDARIHELSHHFNSGSPVGTLLNLVPEVVLILDSHRQVVFANRAALEMAGVEEMEDALGMRPGELIRCKHSHEAPGGCGTTEFCRYCGAVNAVLKSQEGETAVEDCRITIDDDGREEAMDLRVWARPIQVQDETCTFLAIADIADEKRREFLERIFLHDIMNTATALRGFSWLLNASETDPGGNQSYGEHIALLTERMIQEIQAHRQLLAAEKGELKPVVEQVNSYVMVQDTFHVYCRMELLDRRLLRVAPECAAENLHTDPTLLSRVLGNLVKNAIEASLPQDVVTIGANDEGEDVAFWVHNPTCMSEAVRLQIFNRSFSTKGPGRGLGTYSIKFLTERYLGGYVTFTSTEPEGTTFTATYPKRWRGGLPH